MTRETYHLLEFIRNYLDEFAAPIRDGLPATVTNRWFNEFCGAARVEEADWRAAALAKFPLVPSPGRTGHAKPRQG